MRERGPVLVRGTGSIGFRHLSVLRDQLGVETLAMPVRTARGNELAKSGFEIVATLEQAASRRPSCSVVATDTARHLEDAEELLRFGDVLVEKPLAPTVVGIAALETAARANGRAVYVAFHLRFDPALCAFARRLPEIGALFSVRIECGSYLPGWRPDRDYRLSYSARAADGGVLRDLAHDLDYAIWLFGRPDEVFCTMSNRNILGIEAEETADLIWEGRAGVPVSLHLDYVSRVPRREMSASGEHGRLTWDALEGTVTLERAGAGSDVEHLVPDRNATLARELRAFVDGEESGRDQLATLAEGAEVVAVSDAARRSAASGKLEKVRPWQDGT